MPRLPSLNALRAFEAAARSGSVTVAARQLSVTPGAVSHQIKLLEEDLGLRLLQRDGRQVAPTAAARAGLPLLSEAFQQLAAGVEAMRRAADPHLLVVSVVPSFASSWLLPRLDRFWSQAPDVDVRLDTKWGLTDFDREGVDLAIRFGAGGYGGLFQKRLFSEDYSPVCAPALAAGLRQPADLSQVVLLHVDGDYLGPDFPTWRMWLKAAGVEEAVDYRRGPRFHISEFALQAARDGKGVALGSSALVGDDLRRGQLVKPFQQSVTTPFGYYFVCPEENLARPAVAGFFQWIQAEAEAFTSAGA